MTTHDDDPVVDRENYEAAAFPCLVSPLGEGPKNVGKYISLFQQRRMIRWLNAAKDDREAVALGAIIAKCEPGKPCFSGACPMCGVGFQRFAMRVVDQLIAQPARGELRGRMAMVSLIPATGCADPEKLSVETMLDAQSEMLAALSMAEMPPCVLGIDISLNEDETGRVPTHWSVHGHGQALDWPSPAQVEALRRAIPPTTLTSRPVHIKRLDGTSDERVAAYAFEPERVRRVSYLDRSTKDRRPFRNTHRRELRPEQHVALAMVEHEFGLMRRLATHGLDADEVNRARDGF